MASTFFLHQPARRITVSGSLDRAMETLISQFVANEFRLKTAPGTYPATLTYGNVFGSMFFTELWFIPGALGKLVKYARVHIGRDERSANSIIVVLAEGSFEFQLKSIFMLATDGSLAALQGAGVLINASPLMTARELKNS